jgi:hypothetical protein
MPRLTTPRRSLPLVPLLAALCVGPGLACNSSGPRAELSSPSPIARARATVALGERRDPTAVHKLVDLLEDPDQAVRMYAILTLRRMTGDDFGYRYFDREAERQPAVERWRAALREGRVAVRAGGAASPAAGGGGPQSAAHAAEQPAGNTP